MEIVIDHLTHIYHSGTPYEKTALQDIELTIPTGEFVAIIGQTGSGKSTLIQHVNGLLRPTSGRIKIGKFELTKRKKNLQELRRVVGLVFQYPEHQLFEETVEADISYGPLNFDQPAEMVRKRVKQAMDWVGLPYDQFAKRSPFQLSGGQMRRVAIAGVLAPGPKVLILDEPTAGLDPSGKRSIMEMIDQIHKRENLTTILVTHQMDDVLRYADRVLVMDQGRIHSTGTPLEVFAKPETLRNLGLDVPEIIQFIQKLNDKLNVPLPLNLPYIENIVEELKKRRVDRGRSKR